MLLFISHDGGKNERTCLSNIVLVRVNSLTTKHQQVEMEGQTPSVHFPSGSYCYLQSSGRRIFSLLQLRHLGDGALLFQSVNEGQHSSFYVSGNSSSHRVCRRWGRSNFLWRGSGY